MANEQGASRAALLVAEGFEDLEFWVTYMRLREARARVRIVGTVANKEYRGKNGLAASSEVSASDVSADDFDVIVVTGARPPDKLRRYPEVTSIVAHAY